jgi:hypothetical protein
MNRTIEIQGQSGQCPMCQHPPIRHLEDGTGHTCIVCLWMAAEAAKSGHESNKVCTLKFEFRLSKREREQAVLADKESYPPMTICAECWCDWRAHEGYLCPTGDSTFVPDLDSKKPFLFTK